MASQYLRKKTNVYEYIDFGITSHKTAFDIFCQLYSFKSIYYNQKIILNITHIKNLLK